MIRHGRFFIWILLWVHWSVIFLTRKFKWINKQSKFFLLTGCGRMNILQPWQTSGHVNCCTQHKTSLFILEIKRDNRNYKGNEKPQRLTSWLSYMNWKNYTQNMTLELTMISNNPSDWASYKVSQIKKQLNPTQCHKASLHNHTHTHIQTKKIRKWKQTILLRWASELGFSVLVP